MVIEATRCEEATMTLSLSNSLPAAAPLAAASAVTEYQLQAWQNYQIRLAGAVTRIGVARPGEQRCAAVTAGLRCVRRPHPQNPSAHVRVAGDRWWDWEGAGEIQPSRPASHAAVVAPAAAAA
jgi:hypothetical protein